MSWAIFASNGALAARTEVLGNSSSITVNTNQLLGEAERLVDKHRWADAIVAYRTILRSDPKSVPAILGLSASLAQSGKRDEGLSLIIAAANSAKGETRETLVRRAKVLSCLFLTNKVFQVYQEGLNLLIAGKYRNARERFEKALAEESHNVEILTRLGQSLVLDEDFAGAIDKFIAAKKLSPFEPQIRLWLGRSLYFKGSSTLAVSELKTAYQDLQGSEQAALWLAEAMSMAGQTNAAIRLLSADTKKWPFHVLCLLTNAKFRLKLENSDVQSLWVARKDLQLALSRLEEYFQSDRISKKSSLSLEFQRPASEIKAEIQKLLGQVQNKLNEKSPHT